MLKNSILIKKIVIPSFHSGIIYRSDVHWDAYICFRKTMNDIPETTVDRCLLQHQAFSTMGKVSFRRAESDDTPVMIMSLGEREASVPLRALQRELNIADDTPDGRMFALIAGSLDYVSGLSLGDKLPDEVLNGEASWKPGPQHRRLASAWLRVRLLSWFNPSALPAVKSNDIENILRIDEDPDLRQTVQEAFAAATKALLLEDAAVVVGLVERLADELSYIEALRDGLLRRIQKIIVRLDQLGSGWRSDAARLEVMTQVMRLLAFAIKQFADKFDEIDAQTGEVVAALRNVESQQAFIRSNRDWLYRSQRSWERVLREWDEPPTVLDDVAWALVGRTYHFLAPRYMAVTTWQTAGSSRTSLSTRKSSSSMRW